MKSLLLSVCRNAFINAMMPLDEYINMPQRILNHAAKTIPN